MVAFSVVLQSASLKRNYYAYCGGLLDVAKII